MHAGVVTDLQSTDGMFRRGSAGTALRRLRREFLVGKSAATASRSPSRWPTRPSTSPRTRALASVRPKVGPTARACSAPLRVPSRLARTANRTPARESEYWIGSDPTCPICRLEDPVLRATPRPPSPFPNGGWHAEHNKTLKLSLAVYAADRGRVLNRPLPDRRAAVRPQGVATTCPNS